MAQITGARGTGNVLAAKLEIDMSDKIALLQPSAAPLISLMKQLKKNVRVVTNPKFNWLEDDLGARWDAVNNGAGYADNATSVVVDNGDYFAAGDIVKVPRTGEVVLVTAVSTNTLTIVRGYGTTAAAALVDNDPVVIIGNVNEEGATVRTIKSTTETEVFNYCQIWRTPFGLTNTAIASNFYGGNDFNYQQRKKGIEHMVDMSRSFYFGEKKLLTSGTHYKRSTGGLLSFLTENNYDAGGALTQSEFDNNISELVFKYGNKEKLLLCSARLLSVINTWALGKLQINQDAKKFGLNVTEYVTPHGVFQLMHEPLLEGAIYGGYGIALDLDNIAYCPLKGRDTKLRTNIQANDADGRTDEYLTEAGIEIRSPKTHAVITGVTS